MVRGHAKAEAKAKAAKNAPKEAKSSLAVKAEALRFVCPFCKVSGHVSTGTWNRIDQRDDMKKRKRGRADRSGSDRRIDRSTVIAAL